MQMDSIVWKSRAKRSREDQNTKRQQASPEYRQSRQYQTPSPLKSDSSLEATSTLIVGNTKNFGQPKHRIEQPPERGHKNRIRPGIVQFVEVKRGIPLDENTQEMTQEQPHQKQDQPGRPNDCQDPVMGNKVVDAREPPQKPGEVGDALPVPVAFVVGLQAFIIVSYGGENNGVHEEPYYGEHPRLIRNRQRRWFCLALGLPSLVVVGWGCSSMLSTAMGSTEIELIVG
ncbi:hypothetical protein BO99DRAFT_411198 [Aspergillus violaceofuscus CBS 115571]|uniref:Uncharacterized protein n=1 Tax=Aspergillus violaceofuscus (strain CBS 115571) TaxID=1450538 RepID=A0A2V5IMF4_ASPV1|nr:hypothetical protein BO99DRAFT_411198 [Aspergillus violaceofuscus CBS 115571]